MEVPIILAAGFAEERQIQNPRQNHGFAIGRPGLA
jgi:hypothetical protein